MSDDLAAREVFTWRHVRLLFRRMGSFKQVSLRSRLLGPAGGLVTFSRLPVAGTVYRGFGAAPEAPGVSRVVRHRRASERLGD